MLRKELLFGSYVVCGLAVAFLACAASTTMMLPSQASRFRESLQSPMQAIQSEAPKLGTIIQLPKRDYFDRKIERIEGQIVVAMPSCQSCAIKRIDLPAMRQMSKTYTVLVFPEAIPTKWINALKLDHFRVIVEGESRIIPECMHNFPPNYVVLTRLGKIKEYQSQMDADGLKPGSRS